MKKVPYYSNPNNDWCALACYTMVGQYLLPDAGITFEKFKKIADAKSGYVVWAYPVWQWMTENGIKIDNFDITDCEAWAKDGIEGLRKSVSAEEFDFYKKNTFDLEKLTEQMTSLMKNSNYNYVKGKVSWEMIVEAVNKPGICDMTLDGRKLHRRDGFSVHRVVIIDITDSEVIFHDPNVAGDGEYKHESIEFFRSCFEDMSSPELCHYYLA